MELRIVLKRSFSFLSHHSGDGGGGKDDLRSITKGNSLGCSHVLETDYVHALKIRLLGIGSKCFLYIYYYYPKIKKNKKPERGTLFILSLDVSKRILVILQILDLATL